MLLEVQILARAPHVWMPIYLHSIAHFTVLFSIPFQRHAD